MIAAVGVMGGATAAVAVELVVVADRCLISNAAAAIAVGVAMAIGGIWNWTTAPGVGVRRRVGATEVAAADAIRAAVACRIRPRMSIRMIRS